MTNDEANNMSSLSLIIIIIPHQIITVADNRKWNLHGVASSVNNNAEA